MKQLLMAVGMMLAAACSGDVLDEMEFETSQNDVQTDGNNYGFRIDLADSNTRCVTVNALQSQVCVLPGDKNVTVRVTGTGMSAGQKAEQESLVDGQVVRFGGDFPGFGGGAWTLARVTSGGDVLISHGTLPGTNKNSIHTYAHVTVSGATTLDDSGRSGTWMKGGTINCTIDRVKIGNDFTAAERPRVLAHASDYCTMKGFGLGSGGLNTRPTTIPVTPAAVKVGSVGDRDWCSVNSYTATGTTFSPLLPSVCDTTYADN